MVAVGPIVPLDRIVVISVEFSQGRPELVQYLEDGTGKVGFDFVEAGTLRENRERYLYVLVGA
jgi:hypothetical protein